jgi:hypothetical protein
MLGPMPALSCLLWSDFNAIETGSHTFESISLIEPRVRTGIGKMFRPEGRQLREINLFVSEKSRHAL